MGQLAILAAKGVLPVKLAKAYPDAALFGLEGVECDASLQPERHAFSKLGGLFDALKAKGVDQIVFAGGMSRPALNPAEFDPFLLSIAGNMAAAFQQGDDALLRFVISVFEGQGITVRGAHELLPELTAEAGVLTQTTPDEAQLKDAARGFEILDTLAPLDVGQGVVVASRLCLGIETLQGTDALLEFVAQTPDHLRRSAGVFVKAPKLAQDLRVDMPAIGPQTIENIAKAGLSGLVIAAGRVLLLQREEILAAANQHNLFVVAQDVQGASS